MKAHNPLRAETLQNQGDFELNSLGWVGWPAPTLETAEVLGPWQRTQDVFKNVSKGSAAETKATKGKEDDKDERQTHRN